MRLLLILMVLFVLAFAGCGDPDVADMQKDDDVGEKAGVLDTAGMLKTFMTGADEYMVAYKTSIADEEVLSTQYVSDNKMRYDTYMNDANSRMYILDETVISCTQDDEWKCFELGTDEDAMPEQTGKASLEGLKEMSDQLSQLDIRKMPERSIAGTDAICFMIKGMGADQEICYADEGVLLYMAMTSEGSTFVMEATEYSTSVSGADFEPPAEVGSMEDMFAEMMGQYS